MGEERGEERDSGLFSLLLPQSRRTQLASVGVITIFFFFIISL